MVIPTFVVVRTGGSVFLGLVVRHGVHRGHRCLLRPSIPKRQVEDHAASSSLSPEPDFKERNHLPYNSPETMRLPGLVISRLIVRGASS